MRILAITNLYPRLGNENIASFNRAQFRALSLEHEVRAIVPVAWTDRLPELMRLDPRLSHYKNRDGIWVDHPTYYFPPKLMPTRYGEFYYASIRKLVGRVVREFKPEVILSCWAHPDGWAAARLGREFRIPVAVKVVGSDVLVLSRNPARRRVIAESLQGADAVFAVSNDLARHVEQLGVNASKIKVVPEGIDRTIFCPGSKYEARRLLGLPEDRKAILFVGNLLISKGIKILLEACAKLKSRGIAFHCHLLGSAPAKSQVHLLLARYGLGS
ncbi:MAG TPA: glycosyltransferase, partial [Tepidisphaeraceae bacterium]|nr:glycosyltransferase [Tepidisphaeraceae bacterium]